MTIKRVWVGLLGFLALLAFGVASADPGGGLGGVTRTGALPVLQAIFDV
jgi:hypothetical protein